MTAVDEDYLTAQMERLERHIADLDDLYAGLECGARPAADWDKRLRGERAREIAVGECGAALAVARAELAGLERLALAYAIRNAPGGAGSGETR